MLTKTKGYIMNSTTQEVYVGADLHSSNIVLSLTDNAGTEIIKKKVKTNITDIDKVLSPFKSQIKVIGVESTFNWYWFVDGLVDLGYNVKLGNPAKMKQYTGIKVTNDYTDARWLAEQLRLGIFPECYIYPKELRSVRDALRCRQLHVRRKTQTFLSFNGLLARYGYTETKAKDALKDWTLDDIENVFQDHFLCQELWVLIESTRFTGEQIKCLENLVRKFIKSTWQYKRIQQLPGIGDILGMTIVLETGDFNRFKSAGCYASYCRTVKSIRTSNDKKKGQNNRKNGNKYLAYAFMEAANFAVMHYPQVQSWYDRKKKRTNNIVARKALASKLSKAAWHVMKGEDFDMKMMFG